MCYPQNPIANRKLQIVNFKFAPIFSLQFAIFISHFAIIPGAKAQEPAVPPKPAAFSQDAAPPAAATAPAAAQNAAQLSVDQARLADRYKRLEEVVGRLAELSAATDPRRAELLRQAIAQSREEDLNVRFESIVKLLDGEPPFGRGHKPDRVAKRAR